MNLTEYIAKEAFGEHARAVFATSLIWTYPGKGSRIISVTPTELAPDAPKHEEMWWGDVILVPKNRYTDPNFIIGNMNAVAYDARRVFDPANWKEKK